MLEKENDYMRDTVVVIGDGLMGQGIAACSAIAGHKSVIVGLTLDNALKGKEKAIENIEELYENDLIELDVANRAKELIKISDNIENLCENALLIIEAIPEKLELKQELFTRLDKLFPPEVPILSNTSGLRITDIALKTQYPQRMLTAHFWFPAHLVPLVEVVVGDKSDINVAIKIKELLSTWNKSPVIVKRDLPGQLANRILQAVIREAVNIVEIGLADPEDVDTAVKAGMGIRMPVWGPLEHIEAVGLDLCQNVQATVLPGISNRKDPSPLFEKLVSDGKLGYKTGQGLYDWESKSMSKLEKTRNEFIINSLKFINKR